MSPTKTITSERTAEKCLDERVQSKQTRKHKLGNRTNRWSKLQADACCPNQKKQLKQQRQQRQRQHRLKNGLIFNATYESRKNLNSFTLSILPEISQTEY